MHHEYPKWKYHHTAEAQIIDDPGQEEALGPQWHDTPTAAAETPAPEPVTVLQSEPEPKRKRASRAA